MANISTFNVSLLGDAAVGKTSFVRLMKELHVDKRYIATVGKEVHPIPFYTNRGTILLNIWDHAGNKKYETVSGYELRDNTGLKKCDMTIIMYSLDNKKSYENVIHWQDLAPGRPIIFVGNKKDMITNIPQQDFTISCKEDKESVKEFILVVLQTLLGDRTLEFVEPPTYEN